MRDHRALGFRDLVRLWGPERVNRIACRGECHEQIPQPRVKPRVKG